MPSKRLTDLNLITSASNGDLLYIVNNYQPGSPTLTGDSRQIFYSAFTQSLNTVSLTNNSDNSVVTSTGTSNIVGQSNLKISGTSLNLTGATNVTGKGTFDSLKLTGTTPTLTATSVPTLVVATKNTTQTVVNNSLTTITGWTNQISVNGSGWDPTTGVFTAGRFGLYKFTVMITFDTHVSQAINTEYQVIIHSPLFGDQSIGVFNTPVLGVTGPVQVVATSALILLAGSTIQFRAFSNTGITLNIGSASDLNSVMIEELRFGGLSS
jgi:hypothetical protein